MRRTMIALACLAVLFVGTGTALAGGPHHGHGHGYGRGPGHHNNYNNYRANRWNLGYGAPIGPACVPRAPVVAYPGYPVYSVPAYGAYPQFGQQLGFGIAGRNFGLWFQQ